MYDRKSQTRWVYDTNVTHYLVYDTNVTHYLMYDTNVTHVEVSDFPVCHTALASATALSGCSSYGHAIANIVFKAVHFIRFRKLSQYTQKMTSFGVINKFVP